MSDYIVITDYSAKDALLTGNPAKLVKGTEIKADFDAVAVAVATKYDSTDLGVTIQAYDADLTTWAGVTPGTGVATALAVNVGTAGAPVINGGALGTPASGTLTNATGLPAAGVTGTAVVGTTLQGQTYTAFTTAGSSTAYTLTPTPASTANATGQRFRVTFNAASGATPTLAVSGQTAKNLKYYDATGTKQAITSTQVPINWISDVEYDGTDWVVLNVPPVAPFNPASPGAIGGTTPDAITATTLTTTGAQDARAAQYAGSDATHRSAEISKTFNPGASAAIDVATCILGDNYSVAYVTVEAVGVGGSGSVVAVRAVRRVAMVGDSPSFTTIGTDDTSNASIAFSYVATHGFKATITNGVAQAINGGMRMTVVGGGADGADAGITSLT